jgi:CDP-diacylglycerol--serine O-phosphatidyltransferase
MPPVLRRRIRRPSMRRAAPALPNGFTLGNLFFGIFSIVDASHGAFSHAVLWIVLGALCDTFDGRVARATGTGSRFGEELDSLVDAISFGLAPAMIIYFSVLQYAGGAWWLLSFLFCACAVIRLARFNIMQVGRPKTDFVGLPSPAAGITLVTYYWFSQTPLYDQRIFGMPWDETVKFVMGGLAILMISNVPYPAIPKIGLRTWRQIGGTVVVLGAAVGILLYGREFCFPAGMAYVFYGLGKAFVLGLIDRLPAGGDAEGVARTAAAAPGPEEWPEGPIVIGSARGALGAHGRRRTPQRPPLGPTLDRTADSEKP